MSKETVITIQCVHGGFIVTTPQKTEVFASVAKVNKAVRGAIEEYSLVAKPKSDASDSDE